MSWKLVSPPAFYMVFWVAFQAAFWILVWWLGPIVIAKGLARWSGPRG